MILDPNHFADFVRLVERTREAQRTYFRERSHVAMMDAKALERELDRRIDELKDHQRKLF